MPSIFESLPKFAFIVDTEQYAGNFERELCAFMTGIVGECGVGRREAADFAETKPGPNPFEKIIVSVSDDEGFPRPTSIWRTPGWVNNGKGGHLKTGSPEALCLEQTWPAYMSVAVFFNQEPSIELATLMKERANIYCDQENIPITNFRILAFHLETKEKLI